MNDDCLDGTAEEIKIKYYPLETNNLATLRKHYKNLSGNLEKALKNSSVMQEPRSEAGAESLGITYWANYDYSTRSCPTHNWYTTFIKTKAGWMRACCARHQNLTRLPDAFIPLTESQIQSQFAERKDELELVISQLQKKQNARSAATRQANRLVAKE